MTSQIVLASDWWRGFSENLRKASARVWESSGIFGKARGKKKRGGVDGGKARKKEGGVGG